MKRTVVLLTAAALLASCAWQDKGGENSNATDDYVLSVEQADTVDVTDIYDNSNGSQSDNSNKRIILPDVIKPQEISEVYTFNTEDNYDRSNRVERGTEFYKRFFGDDFNADFLYYFEFKGDEDLNFLSYNSKGPGRPAGTYDPDDPAYGTFMGFPDSVGKTDAFFRDSGNMTIAVYDPAKDKDVVMELDDGNCTVGEICETVQAFFDTEFEGFEGLEPRPLSVHYYTGTDNNKTCKRAYVNCALFMGNIPIENKFTHYYISKNNSRGEESTYYAPIYYNLTLGGKDNVLIFESSVLGPQKAVSVNKVENLISLTTATELLEENLAEKMKFKIENVSLIYCRKVTSYDYADEDDLPYSQRTPAIVRDYRPTWVFEFAGGSASLKVDAITGEITVDASPVTMNELRSQHGS